MPTRPATTADEITETIRSLIDRVADARVTNEMSRRGQEVAAVLAGRGAEVGERASEIWRDARPLRRDAARRMARATDDATRWSERTWRKSVRPMMKDLWKRRTVAIGAAGAAVPVGRELVDTAAVRLGLRRQQEARHWGLFFLGLLIGAAAGAIVALLTTPKRGSEMRQEITARARDAEWVPIFERNGDEREVGYGSMTATGSDASGSVQEAAAEAGGTGAASAERPVADAAEPLTDPYETVDRESPA